MINAKDDYASWALLVTELDDAQEHLKALIEQLSTDGDCAEDEFAVQLGHVYAHLNRAWHSRNQHQSITREQWAAFSAYPRDLEPVG
jgi:hypothetical protein